MNFAALELSESWKSVLGLKLPGGNELAVTSTLCFLRHIGLSAIKWLSIMRVENWERIHVLVNAFNF